MNIIDLGAAVVKGVSEIPVDFYYAGRRATEDLGLQGSRVSEANKAEYDRLGDAITHAVKNRQLIGQLVKIVLTEFADKMSPEAEEKLHDAMVQAGVKVGSKQAAKFVLVSVIAEQLTAQIAASAIAKRLVKFGVGILVSGALIYGLVERASNASNRLKRANPYLHHRLVIAKVDMIYFLAEDALAPFVNFSGSALNSPAALKQFQKALEDLSS